MKLQTLSKFDYSVCTLQQTYSRPSFDLHLTAVSLLALAIFGLQTLGEREANNGSMAVA